MPRAASGPAAAPGIDSNTYGFIIPCYGIERTSELFRPSHIRCSGPKIPLDRLEWPRSVEGILLEKSSAGLFLEIGLLGKMAGRIFSRMSRTTNIVVQLRRRSAMKKAFHKNLRIRTFAMVMLLNFGHPSHLHLFPTALALFEREFIRRSTSKPRPTGSVWMPGGSPFTRSQSTRRLTQSCRR